MLDMLSVGLIGLPNVGKSTLFNALTNQNVLVADYPFATIEPNTGVVPLPDQRIHRLGEISQSLKVIPATTTFVDIAGLVKNAHQGEGLGNQFLDHIRQTSVIAQVVRFFGGQAQPLADIEVINTELLLADLNAIEKNMARLQNKSVAQKVRDADLVRQLLKLAVTDINNNVLLSQSRRRSDYLNHLKHLDLLTLKPFIYVFNVRQDSDLEKHRKSEGLAKLAKQSLVLNAKLEYEISQLEKPEQDTFKEEYGLKKSGIENLVDIGFQNLGLQTYFTTGPKESRSWTIKRGSTAQQAAGAIHSDFEKGFIAADIVHYDDFIRCGSWLECKASGLVGLEGKDYVMKDGDIALFKFNV